MPWLPSFLQRLLGRSKRPSEKETPPPEYVSVCPEFVLEKARLGEGGAYLNPNLHFTATDIESHLVLKDIRFAAAVVELMASRLKLGVWLEPLGWGHYSYTVDKVRVVDDAS
jgi:hypothetical protein